MFIASIHFFLILWKMYILVLHSKNVLKWFPFLFCEKCIPKYLLLKALKDIPAPLSSKITLCTHIFALYCRLINKSFSRNITFSLKTLILRKNCKNYLKRRCRVVILQLDPDPPPLAWVQQLDPSPCKKKRKVKTHSRKVVGTSMLNPSGKSCLHIPYFQCQMRMEKFLCIF